MDEKWQLFDENGNPLTGQSATKADVFGEGLLHGASHVWIWRRNNGTKEILLQKRAANKQTWPNKFDISAAGHIDEGETPLIAALRETKEEIGIHVSASELTEMAIEKAYLVAENDVIENEFQWLYLYELPPDSRFQLQESEVDSLAWKTLNDFEAECKGDRYVPHGEAYYSKVINAVANS